MDASQFWHSVMGESDSDNSDFEEFTTAADLVKENREDDSDLDLDSHEIEDNVRDFKLDSHRIWTDCHVP